MTSKLCGFNCAGSSWNYNVDRQSGLTIESGDFVKVEINTGEKYVK